MDQSTQLTFMLDLNKPSHAKNGSDQEEKDLIDIEDPAVVQRRITINKIQDLCSVPYYPPQPAFYRSYNNFYLTQSASVPNIPQNTPNYKPTQFFDVKQTSDLTSSVNNNGVTIPFRTKENYCIENINELDPLYIRQQRAMTESPSTSKETGSYVGGGNGDGEIDNLSENVDHTQPSTSQVHRRESLRNRQKTFDDLQYQKEPVHEFYKDCLSLQTYISNYQIDATFSFLAPVKDYYTTQADCIKLSVYINKKCKFISEKLEFTCLSSSKINEILTEVLLKVLPQHIIDQNNGTIPLSDYCLCVYGTEQVLGQENSIGNFVFVGLELSHDRDVRLELVPLQHVKFNGLQDGSCTFITIDSKPIYYEHFDSFINTLKRNITVRLNTPTDKISRHNILQSLKLIQTYTNFSQSSSFTDAIDLFANSKSADIMQYSVSRLVTELISFFKIYCRCAPTDFSVITEDPVSPLPVKEVMKCNDINFEFIIDSLHNIPVAWSTKYHQYYVEVEVVHGINGLGMQKTTGRVVRDICANMLVFSDMIHIECALSKFPREVHASFVVIGEVRPELNTSSAVLTQDYLASGTVPIFNRDGFLITGPVLLGLNRLSNNILQPWGPQSLIRCPEDPVLRVTFMEYEHDIRFPLDIVYNKCQWRDFSMMSKVDQEFAKTVVENNTFHMIKKDEKEFLWSKRCYLRTLPKALPLILHACFSWDSINVGHIYALLDDWVDLSPEVAVELLLPYFPDQKVRSKAISWIRKASPAFIFGFTPQFVEALRFETYEDSELAKFLLERCVLDKTFAFEFYWQLQQRIDAVSNYGFRARCRVLQEKLCALGIPGFSENVKQQHLFLKMIEKINQHIKNLPDSSMETVLKQKLVSLGNDMDVSKLRIPLNPAFRCLSINLENCGYFNSLTKPLRLAFKGETIDYSVIFKAGDDLRQDAIVLQLVSIMDDIWHRNGLDLRLILFRCLPMGAQKGFIELVPSCRTLREIQIYSGATGVFRDDVINNWLQTHNTSEFEYRCALENFRRSCAGWCLATYLLGIGDRHNDNILITTNGHVFHIDFGKYMGDWQMAGGIKRDRVPFILTPEMVYVINQGKLVSTQHFQKFIDECCQAFNLVRKHSSLLLNAMRFMCCSDIPGLDNSAQQFVENNLLLHLNDVDATITFTRMIQDTLTSVFPRLNFFAHTLAQLKQNPSLAAAFGGITDLNQMSFISGTYSVKQDGRITKIVVSSYEKWKKPEKVYMFKCLIKRENVAVQTAVYRTYDEFNELQLKLRCNFSRIAFPSLGRGLLLGRTNVHSVAAQRQIEIQQFVHMLFDLPEEICHCDLVYTFFHTIYRDEAPEEHRHRLTGSTQSSHPEVFLRIGLEKSERKLKIFVGHARNVPAVNKLTEPDTYVKTYLRRASEKGEKRKTAVVQKSTNPTYNSELTYHLTEGEMQYVPDYIVYVSVWFSSYILKDNFKICEVGVPLKNLISTTTFEQWYRLNESF
ncbi:unnamed protein product [Bursaphelenchus okinawaensis]|uniref:phosphatidylinositol 3-kinase n=1 Tax=Bursaphelenchus okinawaensis TaxID=465554 RepID=A0A811KM32_9BILA|nr:unnamed protein product [Bursaphelenchus okinawaensis]CAG9105050.1 unnamed protein product [Bursaphelenchus okinawaensis]